MKTIPKTITPTTLALATTLILACQPTGKQDTFTDTRDGKKYKIVTIGIQTWMAENLNYNAEGSWCYDNEPENCEKYGRLYDWYTAIKSCPVGWHLPSDDEWQILVDFTGGDEIAGKELKAKDGWNENDMVEDGLDKSGNGADTYGFSALPGGDYCSVFGRAFRGAGDGGSWWSTLENDDVYAYGRYMKYHEQYVLWGDSNKDCGFSVRCVKD